MTPSAKLYSLVEKHESKTQKPTNQLITKKILDIRSAIDSIQRIVADPNNATPRILEGHLGSISHFFRNGKFDDLVLPVLEALKSENPESWKQARIVDTNMPLTPVGFKELKKSCAEISDEFSGVGTSMCKDRELHLLSVYGITSDIINKTFRTLMAK